MFWCLLKLMFGKKEDETNCSKTDLQSTKVPLYDFVTAARRAYAGTEGCYRLLVFIIIFFY